MMHGELTCGPQHTGGCIRDDDVEPAPGIIDVGKNPFDMFRLGDVSFEDQGANSAAFDSPRGLLRARPVAQVVDGNIDLEIGQR
jgi:hypothetical protein